MTGYNGMAPGPTITVTRGEESVVRFINKSKRDSSIHLHGYDNVSSETIQLFADAHIDHTQEPPLTVGLRM